MVPLKSGFVDEQQCVELTILNASVDSRFISAKTGVECDYSWNLGDRKATTQLRHKMNGWRIRTEFSADRPLSEHFQEIFVRMKSALPALRQLRDEYDSSIVLRVIVYYNKYLPSLLIDREVLGSILKMSADLDIDTYKTWPEDKGEAGRGVHGTDSSTM